MKPIVQTQRKENNKLRERKKDDRKKPENREAQHKNETDACVKDPNVGSTEDLIILFFFFLFYRF